MQFEQLDGRRVMAGDIDLAGAVSTHGTWQSESSVLQNQRAAEGNSIPDLVGFAKALRDAGAILYGAAWSQATTEQRQRFEDGSSFLPFVEVTNANRTLNETGRTANVLTFPTWIFPDGSRASGIQSLEVISARSGVAIPTATRANFASVGNQSVAIGSPLHLPIDVYDPENEAVVVTVSVADPTLLEASVLSGNRSVRFDLDGYGDMVFQIFEQQAPRPATRFLELASSDFYDGIIFHRVIDEFVIQAGDPLGIGTGGSTLRVFDDQFNVDLQHNRKGLLSYAKTSDDTNDSQFFITADQTRPLDFNHSIFGILVEGDEVRDAINQLGDINDPGTNGADKPLIDVTINSVDVFTDTENAVVKLKAVGNRTGTTNVTITSTDSRGLTHTEVIAVQVVADSGLGSNSQPFLNDVSLPASSPNNAPVVVQLSSTDVEGDAVQYTASLLSRGIGGTFDSSTGLLSIQAEEGFVGKAFVGVGVRPANGVAGTLGGQEDNQRLVFNFAPVTAPTLPTPTGVDLVAGSDTGASNSDNITRATTYTFTVSGVQTGNEVRVFADGLEIGRGVAAGSTIDITANFPAVLEEGVVAITAAQFTASASSAFSSALSLTLDLTSPHPAKGLPSLARAGEELIANLSHPEEGRGLRYSFAVAPDGAAIDPVTGEIRWTPSASQLGSQAFSLVLTDLAGNSRAEDFNVLIADSPVAGFRLEAADLAGAVVTSVARDEEFLLRFYARDLRAESLRSGVFNAYADLAFNANLVTPVEPAVIEFGDHFAATPSASLSNGSIKSLGATSNVLDATNVAEVLVATVRFRASSEGLVSFSTNPADESAREVNLFDLRNSIARELVQHGQLDLIVGEVNDFGDAPLRYPVTLEQDGARHRISRLFLGANINGESNGTPNDDALADSSDDGVTALTSFVSSTVATTASFSITSSGPGKLDGWIDFNQDADWSDAGEQIFVSRDVVAGENLLSFSVPPGLTEGSTGARFRLSTAGSLAPTGGANDGEVEDYIANLVVGASTTRVDIGVLPGTSNFTIVNDALVVKQGDFVLFNAPVASFGDLRIAGSSLNDVLEIAVLDALSNGTLRIDGGLGKDFLRAIGSGQTFDLTSASIQLNDIEGFDLSGTGDNRLIISIDAVKAASSTTDTLQIRSDFGDTIEFGTGWSAQIPTFVDGQLVHVLTETQGGGTARVELQNARLFQNPLNRFDVDRNGAIQPLDALRIINELSRRGAGPIRVPTNNGEIRTVYVDVSGDNILSALDALRVINAIARINRGGEPEGEQTSSLIAFGPPLAPNRMGSTHQAPSLTEPLVLPKARVLAASTETDLLSESEAIRLEQERDDEKVEPQRAIDLALMSQQSNF